MNKFTFAIALVVAAPLATTLPASTATGAVAAPGQVLPLEGGRNFRDVGGYRTADGKTVRTGMLYRSGSMGKLTPRDQQFIDGLGVRSIIDLRTTTERSTDLGSWLSEPQHHYWTRDYGYSAKQTGQAFSGARAFTRESTTAMMINAYRRLPTEQAAGYRELFARLIAGKGPVIVSCTAGKDRTGVAAALVLTALGCPIRRCVKISSAATARSIPPGFARIFRRNWHNCPTTCSIPC